MKLRYALMAGATLALACAGCKKTADNSINYRNAIDAYYTAHPSCLWAQPQQFPKQVAASDQSANAQYAALVDMGLLQRSTSEKKIVIISKEEINYDLSDAGRKQWTADPNQPGYGNFCYGNRAVTTIDSSTPNDGKVGDTTTVSYHYGFKNVPDWAHNTELKGVFPRLEIDFPHLQTAFPNLKDNVQAAGMGIATLVDTSTGWQVQPSTSSTPPPASSADGKIVE